MNEAALKKDLEELSEILAFPHRAGGPKDDDALHATGLAGETLEDVLSFLRLQVKYLLFDLEATRRENGYLRRMLETRRRPNDDDDPGPGKW